ncbi:hypothetical protein [Gimesia aquarii]|uniref:Uncharacterized protein n=1 Tax=Gimesia aquarii TaxID=2527964 RepID=A0A517WRP1_9PLAN|nr:hypothetical protein [Gimesia aquarii]QDU07888.1 hypothetical protein V202x_12490 [Gimesia aquarii]
MVWPEVSIEDFPPRRDDEPASLRQDILDELTDHFVCALNRELLKNPDEGLAQERVIKNFGDPVKIARQLWFDAMKERIMSQRIMTGISAVMAVCSIAVVGIAWILMRDSQLVNRQMLDQLAVIADRPQADSTVVKSLQSTNEAIVRELKVLADSQRPSRSANDMGMSGMMGAMGMGEGEMMAGGFGVESKPAEPSNINQQILKQLEQLNQKQKTQGKSSISEMHNISFKLVQDTKATKPAVGFKGKLTKSGKQTETFSVDAVSDAKGQLDFGKLPWGKYYLSLYSPWNEWCSLSNISMIPGRDYSQWVVCPTSEPNKITVRFEVNWPEKLKSEDWYLICDFRRMTSPRRLELNTHRIIQDHTWFFDQSDLQPSEKGVYLVDRENNIMPCPLGVNGKYEDLKPETLAVQPSIHLREGQYPLSLIYLVPKQDLTKLSELDKSKPYHVVNQLQGGIKRYNPFDSAYRMNSSFGGGLPVTRVGGGFPVTCVLIPFINAKPGPGTDFGGDVEPDGIQLQQLLTFTTSNDQPNVWKIDLPKLDFLTSSFDSSK